ncbi:hypothetical protein BLA29_006439, partial [Euroglyphus maynei]
MAGSSTHHQKQHNHSTINKSQGTKNFFSGHQSSQARDKMMANNNIEMMNAIEELRRENDRITNELGATQDLLDLFEQYRDLVQEHMSICVCHGKDQLWSRWNQFEQDYKRLLPIKQSQTQMMNNRNGDQYDHNDDDQNSNQQRKLVSLKCQSNVMNGNVRFAGQYTSTSLHSDIPSLWKNKLSNDLDIRLVNCGSENGHPVKSLVRSFLDKIQPITWNNNNSSNGKIVNIYQHSSTQNPVTIIPNNSKNVLIRKRSAASNETVAHTKHHQMMKRLKSTNYQQTSINNNQKSNRSADQDVERLDKLNNALDQILMGKFDALTQLETYVVDKNNNNNNRIEEDDGDGDEDEDEE